jgi:hypothetical protein
MNLPAFCVNKNRSSLYKLGETLNWYCREVYPASVENTVVFLGKYRFFHIELTINMQ